MPNAAEKQAQDMTKTIKSKSGGKKAEYIPTEEELNAIRDAYNETNE